MQIGSQSKRVSNNDWESPGDPDSRIIRMKDGRTRLGYKQEQVVDLETEAVLSVTVHHGTDADTQTMCDSVLTAQGHLHAAGLEAEIEEVAADKGYHSAENLASAREWGFRTYIPEPERGRRRWTGRPDEQEHAVALNRQRMSRAKGRRLQKTRSERVERSFAHECDTGGGRRLWLRGLETINKTRLMTSAGHNLSLVMRTLLGTGKPRAFAALRDLCSVCSDLVGALQNAAALLRRLTRQQLHSPFTQRTTLFTCAA